MFKNIYSLDLFLFNFFCKENKWRGQKPLFSFFPFFKFKTKKEMYIISLNDVMFFSHVFLLLRMFLKNRSGAASFWGHLILFHSKKQTLVHKRDRLQFRHWNDHFSVFHEGQFVPENMMCSSLIHCINRIVRSDWASEAPSRLVTVRY